MNFCCCLLRWTVPLLDDSTPSGRLLPKGGATERRLFPESDIVQSLLPLTCEPTASDAFDEPPALVTPQTSINMWSTAQSPPPVFFFTHHHLEQPVPTSLFSIQFPALWRPGRRARWKPCHFLYPLRRGFHISHSQHHHWKHLF